MPPPPGLVVVKPGTQFSEGGPDIEGHGAQPTHCRKVEKLKI